MTVPGIYDDPVVYDVLATPGTAAELDLLERLYRRFAPRPAGRRRPAWLEPACGTGRLLRGAARRGYRVTGIDRSPALAAYARRRLRRAGLARRARVLIGDMADVSGILPPASVDFAFIPDNSLRHLPDDASLDRHLAGMARVLRPGGVYVVGISLHHPGLDGPDEDVWTARRGRLRVTQLVQYLPPEPRGPRRRRERVISHLVIERPRGVEHRDDVYDLRSYTEQQWRAAVGRSPLRRVAGLDRWGRDRAGRVLPYQLEILAAPPAVPQEENRP